MTVAGLVGLHKSAIFEGPTGQLGPMTGRQIGEVEGEEEQWLLSSSALREKFSIQLPVTGAPSRLLRDAQEGERSENVAGTNLSLRNKVAKPLQRGWDS